ncbi:hypothetical protein FRZ67_13900 [Panacibacter ginsenosidivorans]|uniref:VCBS repeat-containing protein n=1 Tax=Panacibacter ginsenosidivorans TaxID=1813871 RepID=A0A5B8VAP6_9BACT|nr:hypothetical protein [Panacibacter ginsenosidivorans]QEC68339.1 hypothetical protein FRZ67_13900 [Panacibacter ginsenosidivorans]
MLKIIFLVLLITGLSVTADAQIKKIDTTATVGSIGYRVQCSNKDEGENQVSVSPKGFDKEVRDLAFMIRGRLRKILVDDLNGDGYPDLLLCIYGGINGEIGNITCIASSGNKSFVPVRFPDIYSDLKISEGYKGHDEFTTMISTLMQSFPVYKPGDTDIATGGTRVVQYKIMNGENGSLTFKVLRFYEKKD